MIVLLTFLYLHLVIVVDEYTLLSTYQSELIVDSNLDLRRCDTLSDETPGPMVLPTCMSSMKL